METIDSWSHIHSGCYVLLQIIIFMHQCFGDSGRPTLLWSEERLFLRAQCKAKCLRLFQNAEEQSTFTLPWPRSAHNLDQCFKQSPEQCSSECFLTCDQPPKECPATCSDEGTGCFIGCLFLANLLHPRPGECPSFIAKLPDSAQTSSNPACSKDCQLDSDCPGAPQTLKCCPTNCGGSTCTQPLYNDSIPPMSKPLQLLESKNLPLTIDLNWSTPYDRLMHKLGPFVFVLQTRICACKLYDPNQVTAWHTLTMTHLFGAKLDAFERGKMYQFRLAAVNSHGTSGFSVASSPYPRQPVAPYPPGQPRNVTDALWRFHQTDRVSVLLKWAEPEQSDLPIVEYRIKWVVDHGYIQSDGKSMEGLTEFIKTVPQDIHQYLLEGLKASTTYKIQVQAISYWHGFGPIESVSATIFLSTQSVRHTVQPTRTNIFQGPPVVPFDSNIRSSATKNVLKLNQCGCNHDDLSSELLKIKNTFFDNGELWATAQIDLASSDRGMYLLEWSPQVCINVMEEENLPTQQQLKINARTRIIVLEQLRLNCRYSLHLHQLLAPDQLENRLTATNTHTSSSMENTAIGKTLANLCFCTPSCWNVEVRRGSMPESCPPKDPDPPLSPTGLRVEKTGRVDYRVVWQPTIIKVPFRSDQQVNPMSKVHQENSVKQLSFMERRTRTLKQGDSSRSTQDSVDENVEQIIRYRIIWAPRLDEPVDHRMYNEEAGFMPIMDLQESDVRIVGPKHTSMDLKGLKESTVYVVRVQTLVSLPTGEKLESTPASVFFVTSRTEGPRRIHEMDTDSENRLRSDANVILPRLMWPISFITYMHS